MKTIRALKCLSLGEVRVRFVLGLVLGLRRLTVFGLAVRAGFRLFLRGSRISPNSSVFWL